MSVRLHALFLVFVTTLLLTGVVSAQHDDEQQAHEDLQDMDGWDDEVPIIRLPARVYSADSYADDIVFSTDAQLLNQTMRSVQRTMDGVCMRYVSDDGIRMEPVAEKCQRGSLQLAHGVVKIFVAYTNPETYEREVAVGTGYLSPDGRYVLTARHLRYERGWSTSATEPVYHSWPMTFHVVPGDKAPRDVDDLNSAVFVEDAEINQRLRGLVPAAATRTPKSDDVLVLRVRDDSQHALMLHLAARIREGVRAPLVPVRVEQTVHGAVVIGYAARISTESATASGHSIKALASAFEHFSRRVWSLSRTPIELAIASDERTLHYGEHQMDAFGGMSGAPIFNTAGDLIGLHVGGHQRAYNVFYPVLGNEPLAAVLHTYFSEPMHMSPMVVTLILLVFAMHVWATIRAAARICSGSTHIHEE